MEDVAKGEQGVLATKNIINTILREGIGFRAPDWITRCRVTQSVLILADAQLKYWPAQDKLCRVEYHPDWPIKRWSQAIRMGTIKVEHTTVVIYLESTRHWGDIPLIKNTLHKICKVVRNMGNNPRIFVANHLCSVYGKSPLHTRISWSNFILQQATRSVGRAMGRVFELSLYEHFISSRKEKVLHLAQHYFVDSERLMALGCMIFRECVLRETGLKPYWFEGK